MYEELCYKAYQYALYKWRQNRIFLFVVINMKPQIKKIRCVFQILDSNLQKPQYILQI